MLKKHGCTLPEGRLAAFDLAPSKWEEVLRKAFGAKEVILPLQNKEVTNIRNKLDEYTNQVFQFRERFLREAPFEAHGDPQQAYEAIDAFYQQCLDMEAEAKELNNLETLFDLAKSVHKELKDTKEELKILKVSWENHS